MNSTSPKYVFDNIDLLKTLRTFGVVTLSTGALFILQTFMPSVTGHLPAQYAFLIPIITSGGEALRRYLTDHSQF